MFLRKYFGEFFTEETENFLCFTTRFEEDERITIEQACNHHFLVGFDPSSFSRSSSDGLGGLFRCFLRNDNLQISKVLLNTILKQLCAYYVTGERWYEQVDISGADETGECRFTIEKGDQLLQYLSYEFGVSVDHLWKRLQSIKQARYRYVEDGE